MEMKQLAVLICLVHLLACLVLLGVAVYRASRFGKASNSPRALLPFLIISGITATLTAGLALVHWTVHNGTIVDAQILKMRFGGTYWWVYVGTIALPLLPLVGIFIPVARHPWIVAGFAVGAILGSTFLLTLF